MRGITKNSSWNEKFKNICISLIKRFIFAHIYSVILYLI